MNDLRQPPATIEIMYLCNDIPVYPRSIQFLPSDLMLDESDIMIKVAIITPNNGAKWLKRCDIAPGTDNVPIGVEAIYIEFEPAYYRLMWCNQNLKHLITNN